MVYQAIFVLQKLEIEKSLHFFGKIIKKSTFSILTYKNKNARLGVIFNFFSVCVLKKMSLKFCVTFSQAWRCRPVCCLGWSRCWCSTWACSWQVSTRACSPLSSGWRPPTPFTSLLRPGWRWRCCSVADSPSQCSTSPARSGSPSWAPVSTAAPSSPPPLTTSSRSFSWYVRYFFSILNRQNYYFLLPKLKKLKL